LFVHVALFFLRLLSCAEEDVDIFLVAGPESSDECPPDRSENLNGGGWLKPAQHTDGHAGDAEEDTGLQRGHIRGAGPVIDQGDLSEKISRFQCGEHDFTPVCLNAHFRAALEHHVEAVPGFAGLDNPASCRTGHRIGQLQKRRELLPAQARKQAELLQAGIIRLDCGYRYV